MCESCLSRLRVESVASVQLEPIVLVPIETVSRIMAWYAFFAGGTVPFEEKDWV